MEVLQAFIVNGITKELLSNGEFRYLFDTVTIFANNDDETIQVKYKERYDIEKTTLFSDLQDNFGTTTPEGYCDYLANNDYYRFSPTTANVNIPDPLNVNIAVDSVGLAKEAKQDIQIANQVIANGLLQDILNALLVSVAAFGWLYKFSNTQTLETNFQIVYHEELLLEDGAEFQIELDARLYLEI